MIETKERLERHLCTEISINNVIQLLRYSDTSNCPVLTKMCLKFIDENIRGLLSSDVINYLPSRYLSAFLSRDQIVVDEIGVFHCISRWIAFNQPDAEERFMV